MELWAATYVEIDFLTMSVNAFGNLRSELFNSAEDAWEAVREDIEVNYGGMEAEIDEKNNHAQLINFDGHGNSVFWEVQKMQEPF